MLVQRTHQAQHFRPIARALICLQRQTQCMNMARSASIQFLDCIQCDVWTVFIDQQFDRSHQACRLERIVVLHRRKPCIPAIRLTHAMCRASADQCGQSRVVRAFGSAPGSFFRMAETAFEQRFQRIAQCAIAFTFSLFLAIRRHLHRHFLRAAYGIQDDIQEHEQQQRQQQEKIER